jgi:hypothetical protein
MIQTITNITIYDEESDVAILIDRGTDKAVPSISIKSLGMMYDGEPDELNITITLDEARALVDAIERQIEYIESDI